MKKSFTLIELLVVVAIIGILAAVGTPIFQGFVVDAKINATRINHNIIKNFITASLTKCSVGSGYIELLRPVSCSKNISQMSDEFAHYFDLKAGFENPYNKNEWAVTVDAKYYKKTGKCLWLGTTCIYGSDNKIYIGTNIGDKSGGSVFLNDIIARE
ncbi:MAG: prepilin-type N-terminal cleavage/methylation domain-containing protein [Bacteroidetes bacterium]|nr:prepilin-type N-terminal cleavage/methylation domain-containing protein [Bacteroidota bacterium]MBL7003869.1 prepilin-type N-terminal cleavage/methylation domain-containing protein [Gammaproteobacteria bacterium]